jgi:hypothetical protein
MAALSTGILTAALEFRCSSVKVRRKATTSLFAGIQQRFGSVQRVLHAINRLFESRLLKLFVQSSGIDQSQPQLAFTNLKTTLSSVGARRPLFR